MAYYGYSSSELEDLEVALIDDLEQVESDINDLEHEINDLQEELIQLERSLEAKDDKRISILNEIDEVRNCING